jgi:hypothetical protein
MSGARRGVFTLPLLAMLALSAPAFAEASAAGVSADALAGQRSATHWAHPAERAPVRARPTAAARKVTGLHRVTEDGFPEVYPVLREATDSSEQDWLKVRVPMRPDARTGWVRDRALGRIHTVRTRLTVDRGSLRATLYRSGDRIWRSRIGVGKPRTPTPAGRFWIRERIKVRGSGSIYGPWAFGTSAYSRLSDWPGGGVIGIHGTNQPSLIPGRPSHGCVRVPNGAMDRLARRLPIGTPVRIR